MRRHFSVFAIAMAGFSLLLAGCGGGSGTTQATPTGYYVYTAYGPLGAVIANPSVTFDGTSTQQQLQCVIGATGCAVETGWQVTNAASGSTPGGTFTVPTNDLPDYWGFTTLANGNCSQNDTYPAEEVLNGQTVELLCGQPTILFTATPAIYISGYLQTKPAPTSITLTTTTPAFPTTPSLPTVDSYDESADLQAAMSASSVSSNQESLVFPVSSSILVAGNHILVVRDASGNVIGAAPFSVFVVLPPPRSPCPTIIDEAEIKKGTLGSKVRPMMLACPPAEY
jgi:hypothetical protein